MPPCLGNWLAGLSLSRLVFVPSFWPASFRRSRAPCPGTKRRALEAANPCEAEHPTQLEYHSMLAMAGSCLTVDVPTMLGGFRPRHGSHNLQGEMRRLRTRLYQLSITYYYSSPQKIPAPTQVGNLSRPTTFNSQADSTAHSKNAAGDGSIAASSRWGLLVVLRCVHDSINSAWMPRWVRWPHPECEAMLCRRLDSFSSSS